MKKYFLSNLIIAALIISAAFVSCNKDDDDGGNTATSITAKIDNASEFSDVKKVKIMAEYYENNTWKEYALAEADFKDGGFTINLPATVDAKYLEPYDEEEMPQEINVSNTNAKTLWIWSVKGFNSADEQIARFWCGKEDSNSDTSMNWLYTDSDVNISGTNTSTEEEDDVVYEFTVIYSLVLKKGWNVVYDTYSQTKQGNKYIEKYEAKSSAVSGLKWIGEVW